MGKKGQVTPCQLAPTATTSELCRAAARSSGGPHPVVQQADLSSPSCHCARVCTSLVRNSAEPTKAQDSSPCFGPAAACTGANQQTCTMSCVVPRRRHRAVLLPAAELAAAGAGRAIAQCQRECAHEVPCCQRHTHQMPKDLLTASYDSASDLPCSADIYISVFLDRLLVRCSQSLRKASAVSGANVMLCLQSSLIV